MYFIKRFYRNPNHDLNVQTTVRCFKARDGNGWQVSQQHSSILLAWWRLAAAVVRAQWRQPRCGRRALKLALLGGNGGPYRVHCHHRHRAHITRPKASFERWKAVPAACSCCHHYAAGASAAPLLFLSSFPSKCSRLGRSHQFGRHGSDQDPILCTTTAVTLSPF